MNDLVPFGKYKGQPVDQLRNDKEYCEWLVAQPWLASRFKNIHTLIINNFSEASETPEHNAMQMRFLDNRYLVSVLITAYPKLFETAVVDGKLIAGFRMSKEFETSQGWDVAAECTWGSNAPWDRALPPYESYMFCVELKPVIGDDFPKILRDVKQRRTDAYMRCVKLVVADEIVAQGATQDQIRAMYQNSGIVLITTSDVVVVG